MSIGKYVDKIWQNMARQQLENELNFLTTDDNKKIKLPIDDNIDYLKMYSNTHKTPEEELQERIDKAIEYIENNDLYTQDIDYDYDDNMVLLPPTDELERKELLEILRGEDNE